MPHDHDKHYHGPKDINKTFVTGIALNLSFVLLEASVGFWKNSLALLTDAGHNFSDVIGLLFVLMAQRLAKMKPTQNFTYGYSKSTVLIALANALLLLVAVGAIGWEAISRMSEPHPVEGGVISIVAVIGLVMNAMTAALFFKDRHKDLNIKGAYLHMAADAAVSLGVVIAGIIIMYTKWFWIDAVISLIIIVVIVSSTWGLLRDSIRLSLDGVPLNIDPKKVREYLSGLKEVTGFHDLHIWAMSTTDTAMTVHLIMPEGGSDVFLSKIKDELNHHFNITHTTIQ
ncbi:MAG TPA: cation diffusion facilitator family transporter, partial [Nitrosopumilaceae archaeon]|nr:cation diffusion facilitator family transporter [Nitrosopumilaceae archaeon]